MRKGEAEVISCRSNVVHLLFSYVLIFITFINTYYVRVDQELASGAVQSWFIGYQSEMIFSIRMISFQFCCGRVLERA